MSRILEEDDSKVTQDEMTTTLDEVVLGLDVAVNCAIGVNKSDCLDQWPKRFQSL
jgi:hypothetical protein